jgi:hypothetical protein
LDKKFTLEKKRKIKKNQLENIKLKKIQNIKKKNPKHTSHMQPYSTPHAWDCYLFFCMGWAGFLWEKKKPRNVLPTLPKLRQPGRPKKKI